MGYEWVGYAMVLAGVLCLSGFMVASRRFSERVKILILVALILRVVGSLLRYYLLHSFYGGTGDAVEYFMLGEYHAERFSNFDFGAVFDESQWRRGSFTGTHFMDLLSGVAVLLIGPSQRAEFLFFALLAFAGLIILGLRTVRHTPELDSYTYLSWLLLWPSLWYWPSSIGKDAVMLFGLCMTMTGYLGKDGGVQWTLMLLGLFTLLAIRPQVAALTAAVVATAYWLSFEGKWTPARISQGIVILIACLGLAWWGATLEGISSFDAEGMQSYLQDSASSTAGSGGSGIEAIGASPTDIPMAMITTLARPFPWEANNVLALASSLEMVFLWGLIWYYRSGVLGALKSWRRNRILRFALPFLVLYSLLLGMAVGNLGIVARQRVYIFPVIFLLLAWQSHQSRRPLNRERPVAHG